MDNVKESIDTLITTGASLPSINPDLYDHAYADVNQDPKSKKASKNGKEKKKELKPAPHPKKANGNYDPTDYIAELERPEEEELI